MVSERIFLLFIYLLFHKIFKNIQRIQNLQKVASNSEIWIVYRFFESKDDFKWKKFELQSCKSCRKLQFSYKCYPHPSSYQKVMIFWREVVSTATGNNGRNPLQYPRRGYCSSRRLKRRLEHCSTPNAVSRGRRSLPLFARTVGG
jgi:hypothetical protein